MLANELKKDELITRKELFRTTTNNKNDIFLIIITILIVRFHMRYKANYSNKNSSQIFYFYAFFKEN